MKNIIIKKKIRILKIIIKRKNFNTNINKTESIKVINK